MNMLEIQLDRKNKTFRPNDIVSGRVIISSQQRSMSFNSIYIYVEGLTSVHVNAKNVGLFEAFYGSMEPYEIFQFEREIHGSGSIGAGRTEFPFEFKLLNDNESSFFETYHGVYINTAYKIRAEVSRGFLSTTLEQEVEFLVEVPMDGLPPSARETKFIISPTTVQNIEPEMRRLIPDFHIVGKFHSLTTSLTQPLTGEITIEHSAVDIQSIDIQLVRVETVSYTEGIMQEATEIIHTQIGDGDVCRGLVIPIFAIYPKLFMCPTMITSQFRIEFEVNIVVIFKDENMVNECFPLSLFRVP